MTSKLRVGTSNDSFQSALTTKDDNDTISMDEETISMDEETMKRIEEDSSWTYRTSLKSKPEDKKTTKDPKNLEVKR